MRVKFGPWTPDQPDLDSGGLEECVNCMPLESGYGPVRDGVTLTGTSSAPFNVVGHLTIQDQSSGANFMYVGTRNTAATSAQLYRYSNFATTTDITRATVGRTASYAGNFSTWSFARFGTTVLAANQSNTMQISVGGGNFRDQSASASAPQVQYLAAVRDFVFGGFVAGNGGRLQWCQINNPQRWGISPRLQSDLQELPDTGLITGMTGGDFGVILTDNSVWRATYVGSPVIFRFDEVVPRMPCIAPLSVARYQNLTFFLARSGLQLFDGSQCIPIGKGAVDKYLLDVALTDAATGVTAAIDEINQLYIIGVSSRDLILIYNWNTKAWASLNRPHHFVTKSIIVAGANNAGIASGVVASYRAGIGLFVADGSTDVNYTELIGSTYATATFATGEAQIFPGRRGFVTGVRPLIQGNASTSITTEIAGRDKLTDSISYAAAVATNSNGFSPQRVNARYHRVRLNVSGGFERAIGFDLDARPEGTR